MLGMLDEVSPWMVSGAVMVQSPPACRSAVVSTQHLSWLDLSSHKLSGLSPRTPGCSSFCESFPGPIRYNFSPFNPIGYLIAL